MSPPRPETTGELLRRVNSRMNREHVTPGPEDALLLVQKLSRYARYGRWPAVLAVSMLGAVAAGSVWLYRINESMTRLESVVEVVARQGGEIAALRWSLYRYCRAAGLDDCPRPDGAR